jgi:hypothetical protein
LLAQLGEQRLTPLCTSGLQVALPSHSWSALQRLSGGLPGPPPPGPLEVVVVVVVVVVVLAPPSPPPLLELVVELDPPVPVVLGSSSSHLAMTLQCWPLGQSVSESMQSCWQTPAAQ